MDTISSVSYSRAYGLVLTSTHGQRVHINFDIAGWMKAYAPNTPSKLPDVGAPWVDVEMAQQSWGRDVTPNPYQQRRCAGPLVAYLYGGCSLDRPSWRRLTSHGRTKHEDGSILLGLARRQADSGPAHDPRSCSQTHPTLALRSAIHTDGTPRFRVADLSGAIHRRRGHDGDSRMKEAVSIWSILAMVAIVIGSGVAETIATRF